MSVIDYSIFNGAWWNEGADPEPRWCYDRAVQPHSSDRDEIVEDFLAPPWVSDEKETVPMVSFTTFLEPESAVETLNRRSGIYTKAIRDNVVAVTALTIDMESKDWPIKRFLEVHGALEFVLATSYKHASEAEHNFRHRYRAVFPLVVPLPATNIIRPDFLKHTNFTVLPDLKALFSDWDEEQQDFIPFCDQSSFDRGRCVFVSSCPQERLNLHRAEYNHGSWLDWRELTQVPGEIRPRAPAAEGSIAAMRERMATKRGKTYSWTGAGDCPFVKESKTEEYYSTSHGDHHRALFRWMCSVAGTAKAMGRPLDEMELADLARDVHLRLPCGQCQKGGRPYNREARNALGFIGA